MLSLLRVFVGVGISPLAQAGLNEALDLAVSLWRIGLGANVPETETLTGSAEGKGPVAGAVVGHHALDLDTELCVIGDCGPEEGCGTSLLLVGRDVGEGNAGVIVDTNMRVLPANPAAIALACAVAGDAMADLIEFTELFDVDVDQFAGPLALVAPHRLGWFQRSEPIEAQPPKDAAHRRWRDQLRSARR